MNTHQLILIHNDDGAVHEGFAVSISISFHFNVIGEIDRMLFWSCYCSDPFAVGKAQHWLSYSSRNIQRLFRFNKESTHDSF